MNDRSIYPLGRRRTLVVLGGVLLGMLLASLNQTIVATAMPTIASDLGGLDRYSWVFSAYMLGSTVAIPLYGKLSDIYGRRPFFLLGIALFVTGSLVAGLAPSMDVLIAGRAVQGVGAGGLIPLGIAVLGDIIPPRKRGQWQALLGTVFGVSNVVGPATGGWIADSASWRLAFFVSLPLAALAVVVVWFSFGQLGQRTQRRIDYLGALLLTGGASAGLLAAVWGGVEYSWTSSVIVALLVVSALALFAFLRWERRVLEPLLPLDLFRSRAVATAEVALFAVGAAALGTVIFVPLFVQGVLGASATHAGAVLTPLMLSWIGAGVVAGQVVSRTGRYRSVLLTGPPLMALGFVLLATMGTATSTFETIRNVVVVGIGVGLMMQTLVVVVQNAVPRGMMGIATASAQFSRWIGATVGVTLMGAIATSHLGGDVTGARPAELAAALQPAFAAGIGLAVLAFVAAVLMPQTELRARFDERPVGERAGETAVAAKG